MDTPVLLLLLLAINKGSNISSQDTLHTVRNYLSSIEINYAYTKEKIKIAKKVIPLLPIEYVVPVNKSVVIAEKIVKILEVKEFINSYDDIDIKPMVLESKERLHRIVNTIQEEVKNSKLDEFGMALELVLNIDRLKKMISSFSKIMTNKNSLSDPESIYTLLEILMEGSSEEDKEKMKEMVKMFDIIKLLSNDNKPNED
jgi:hypothetical protein